MPSSEDMIRAAPDMDAVRPLFEEAKVQLGPSYLEYIFTVSNAAWSISLDLAAFLLALCRTESPATIADLGSGFSSFVFRTYAREREPGVRVVSVDHSSDWLTRTREFLETNGLSTDALVSAEDFADAPSGTFDLVFHDLGDMTVRAQSLDVAIESARRNGLIVLDDLHMWGYPDLVAKAARAHGRRILDLAPLTRDEIGRYAWALGPACETVTRSA